MVPKIFRILSLILPIITLQAVTCTAHAAPQLRETPAEPPLFAEQSMLEIAITGPISSLIKAKRIRKQEPFVLHANDQQYQVKIRQRGKSRKKLCEFPPLRLNFSKRDTRQSIFEGQDKIKLVSKCGRARRNDLDTLLEYAAYRIFNLISDTSYKVRLVNIRYSDTDNRLKKGLGEQYGFLIESDSALASRLGLRQVELDGVSLAALDPVQMVSVYIFQYLIGNTDWSLVSAEDNKNCCHNGDIFKSNSRLRYVPYDFDLAGLVNTRYARPDPSVRIRKVTQRRYRGFCGAPELLRESLDRVLAQKSAIMSVIRDLPLLSEKERKTKIKFLNKFFAQAENQENLIQLFQRQCL